MCIGLVGCACNKTVEAPTPAPEPTAAPTEPPREVPTPAPTPEPTAEPEPTAAPSPEPTAKPTALKKDGVGLTSTESLALYDVVTLGRYPQNALGGSADIEWIVIGFDGDNRAKLLSRSVLDAHKYHDNQYPVSWTSSSLYLWLNSSFKEDAFNEEEQALLAGGISIPSVEEAKALPASYLQCESTIHALAKGADPLRCIWWLNDQTMTKTLVNDEGESYTVCYGSVVDENGTIRRGTYQLNFGGKVVRPMIIVDLDPNAVEERASALVQRRGEAIRSASDLKEYDTITFGKYVQSPDAAPAEIEWLVIGTEGEKVKLISKYGLDTQRYNTAYSNVTWDNCTLHAWLDDTFKPAAFSADEQKLLVDGVGLPSEAEAKDIPRAYRISSPTAYAVANGALKKPCYWWLNDSPKVVQYEASGKWAWCASAVNELGTIGRSMYQINYDGKTVRPVITVDLSKLP